MKKVSPEKVSKVMALLDAGEMSHREISTACKVGEGWIREMAKACGPAPDKVNAGSGPRGGVRAREEPLAESLDDMQPEAKKALPILADWTLAQLRGTDSRGPKGLDAKTIGEHLKNLNMMGQVCPEVLVKVRGEEEDGEEVLTEEEVLEELAKLPPRLLRLALTKMGGVE